jgi:hypothetical protein
MFFAELSFMVSIHAGYTLESVRGRDPQDIVDFFIYVVTGGIPGRRALRSDGVDLDSDDSGMLRELEERLVLELNRIHRSIAGE